MRGIVTIAGLAALVLVGFGGQLEGLRDARGRRLRVVGTELLEERHNER